MPSSRKKSLVHDIAEEADQYADQPTVALEIDARMAGQVWNGTRFDDRTAHLLGDVQASLVQELEKALNAQESFTDFEQRMLGRIGVPSDLSGEPRGWLADVDRQLEMETRLAWNEALLSNAKAEEVPGERLIPIWRAILDDRTTYGCGKLHGEALRDIHYEKPPRHWMCRCEVILVAPDELDPTQEDMGNAREAWMDEYGSTAMRETDRLWLRWRPRSERPASRLFGLVAPATLRARPESARHLAQFPPRVVHQSP